MKTVGKQRFRGTKASLHAYLKFSPMNYISISIILLLLIFENPITILYPPDWDLQGDHSLLHTNNLRGIDPYSHKVYYLDEPVHLLVSCIEVVNEKWFIKTCVQSFWRRCLRSQFRAPPSNSRVPFNQLPIKLRNYSLIVNVELIT